MHFYLATFWYHPMFKKYWLYECPSVPNFKQKAKKQIQICNFIIYCWKYKRKREGISCTVGPNYQLVRKNVLIQRAIDLLHMYKNGWLLALYSLYNFGLPHARSFYTQVLTGGALYLSINFELDFQPNRWDLGLEKKFPLE